MADFFNVQFVLPLKRKESFEKLSAFMADNKIDYLKVSDEKALPVGKIDRDPKSGTFSIVLVGRFNPPLPGQTQLLSEQVRISTQKDGRIDKVERMQLTQTLSAGKPSISYGKSKVIPSQEWPKYEEKLDKLLDRAVTITTPRKPLPPRKNVA